MACLQDFSSSFLSTVSHPRIIFIMTHAGGWSNAHACMHLRRLTNIVQAKHEEGRRQIEKVMDMDRLRQQLAHDEILSAV